MAALLAGRIRMAATLASAAIAATSLSGCGGDGRDDPPEPSTAPSATPGVDRVDAPQGTTAYPATVAEYAEATVAAWAAPDLIRLAELTAADVHTRIVEFPGPPDLDWAIIGCEAEAVPAVCTFHNATGDQLWLTVDPDLVTRPYAVVDVELEVTPYPKDPRKYVEAFVAAWQVGNPPRMDNLAVPAAADVLRQLPPEPEPGYRVRNADQDQITVVIVLAGVEVRTTLTAALLGEPEAIRAAEIRER